MESVVYHYFENEEDKVPVLTVEYLKTTQNTFARSFKLLKGAFTRTEGGKTFSYNFVEVSVLTKSIIYMLNNDVVFVQTNASSKDLVGYVEDQ